MYIYYQLLQDDIFCWHNVLRYESGDWMEHRKSFTTSNTIHYVRSFHLSTMVETRRSSLVRSSPLACQRKRLAQLDLSSPSLNSTRKIRSYKEVIVMLVMDLFCNSITGYCWRIPPDEEGMDDVCAATGVEWRQFLRLFYFI